MNKPLSRYRYELFLTLIFLGVIFTILYVQRGGDWHIPSPSLNRPSSTNTILNTFTGNKTGTTATIVFQTQKPTRTSITYGDTPTTLRQKQIDVRDTSAMRRERTTHVFELQGLSPEKKYYVSLLDDEGNSIGTQKLIYEFTSSQRISTVSTMSPVYGHVLTEMGNPATNTVVLLETANTEPILDVTDADGSFLIPLCCILTKEGHPVQSLPPETSVSVRLYDENGRKKVFTYGLETLMDTSVALNLGDEKPQAALVPSEVPDAVLGLQSDQKESSKSTSPTSSPTPTVNKIQSTSLSTSPLQILYPENKASISSQPLIKGISTPDDIVTIFLKKGKDISYGRARGDKTGIWYYSPETVLLPGDYSITAQSSGKKPLSATVQFTVLKSGEAVLGVATGSATLTPAPEPTVASDAGSITVTPASTITAIPTITKTPPISGSTIVPVLFVGSLSFFVGLGLILLL